MKHEVKPGKILISDPFLEDTNFNRTIVLMTEHNDMGSFGFVLNNRIDISLDRVLKDEELPDAPIFQGGPVELNTLHFIHSLGSLIPNSKPVMQDVWWGGDYEKTLDLLRRSPELASKMVFFIGYSGWAGGQLDGELAEEAWVVSDIGSAMIFKPNLDAIQIWKQAMYNLGGKYTLLADGPSDPELN